MRGKLKYPIYHGLQVIFAKKGDCVSQGGKRGYYSIKKNALAKGLSPITNRLLDDLLVFNESIVCTM